MQGPGYPGAAPLAGLAGAGAAAQKGVQPGPAYPGGPILGLPGDRGVEETQPSKGDNQRAAASAPSPADIQPTRPANHLPEGQSAKPERVGASPVDGGAPKSKKPLIIAGIAVAAVGAIVAGIFAFTSGSDNSPEGKVRGAITAFSGALKDGDLNQLRATTCGDLHTFYQEISPEQFRGVHKSSADRGTIPVVSSVNAVRITDNAAIAEATVAPSGDPGKPSARTFDLQNENGTWKVCDPAAKN
ncbi:hypothetical protein GCM10011591_25040 [Nocardia camponoti]|uniref:DUF4878 domain-containing protein n=1 Tax=Nocardia camponoti TaxID=1616106 RepID=A0A917QIS9_9NOCA|nr:hypothetical protein GCM10011591_25040 [Nocardia camponoti]